MEGSAVKDVKTDKDVFSAHACSTSKGGLSLSSTGATGSGYTLAKDIGHIIKETYPSGVPLFSRETWTGKCTSETIPKVKASLNQTRANVELMAEKP